MNIYKGWRIAFLTLVFILITICHNCIYGAQVINVMTFNILAPCWASPSYYPDGMEPHVLDADNRTAAMLKNVFEINKTNIDIFALQETTEAMLTKLSSVLKDYDLYAAYHEPYYWENWITADPPWTKNGVALYVKKGLLMPNSINKVFDRPVSDDGNHCAYIEGNLKDDPSKKLRIACIHFDSDRASNRLKETNALLATYMQPMEGTIDIIAGDFNFETETGTLMNVLSTAGFINILEATNTSYTTQPFDSAYYHAENWAEIDHVLIRKPPQIQPLDGEVYHHNLFIKYPVSQSDPTKERDRVNDSLKIVGSDHFPVRGTSTVQ